LEGPLKPSFESTIEQKSHRPKTTVKIVQCLE